MYPQWTRSSESSSWMGRRSRILHSTSFSSLTRPVFNPPILILQTTLFSRRTSQSLTPIDGIGHEFHCSNIVNEASPQIPRSNPSDHLVSCRTPLQQLPSCNFGNSYESPSSGVCTVYFGKCYGNEL